MLLHNIMKINTESRTRTDADADAGASNEIKIKIIHTNTHTHKCEQRAQQKQKQNCCPPLNKKQQEQHMLKQRVHRVKVTEERRNALLAIVRAL